MSANKVEAKLEDGTLIRHKVAGYEGRIDGTTQVQSCFTVGGALLAHPSSKHLFQYRVVVEGETLRRIAPADDFEILEAVVEVICPSCHACFQTKPGLADKPRGRCKCGGWICPTCLSCQETNEETVKTRRSCPNQRRRVAARLAVQKKANSQVR